MELIKYLPEYLRPIKQLKEITRVEQDIIDGLNSDLDSIERELYIESAGDYGLGRLEKMLGIYDIDYKDLDYRRFRLLLKLTSSSTPSIRERLNNILGEENFTMEMVDNCLEVRIVVKSKEYLEEIRGLLDKIVPLNIELDVRILYVSHKMLSKYTHKELSALRNEAVKVIGLGL